MKIRTGFVSNSSSSSFLIYGVALDRSEIFDLLKKGKNSKAEAKSGDEDEDEWDDEDEDEDEDDDVYGVLETALAGTKLEYHIPYDDGTAYIGACWSNVGDDETGKQFKDRVKTAINEVFGKGQACGTHSEAWRDG